MLFVSAMEENKSSTMSPFFVGEMEIDPQELSFYKEKNAGKDYGGMLLFHELSDNYCYKKNLS